MGDRFWHENKAHNPYPFTSGKYFSPSLSALGVFVRNPIARIKHSSPPLIHLVDKLVLERNPIDKNKVSVALMFTYLSVFGNFTYISL